MIESENQPWWPPPKGPTRIIVPIVAKTLSEALGQAIDAALAEVDLVEWRVDYLESQYLNPGVLIEVAYEIGRIIAPKPLIFTWRTADEGGVAEPADDAGYAELLTAIIKSGAVDLVDIQFHHRAARQLAGLAHECKMPVIGSWHDITGTPSETEIGYELEDAEDFGASIVKIAVTARHEVDTESLLAATLERALVAWVPIITIAMGEAGLISRLYGHFFGSTATFASLNQASAPGQPSLDQLKAAW